MGARDADARMVRIDCIALNNRRTVEIELEGDFVGPPPQPRCVHCDIQLIDPFRL